MSQGRLDETVLVWNGVVARVPALAVQPTSAQDVAAAVRFARDHGLTLSIKGGTHDGGATSIVECAVTLDLSLMRDITVDVEAGLAHVGPGCLPGDYVTRPVGWPIDNLEEVEIVTADGSVRVANRHENADVFRKLRSGVAEIGVVTRWTFSLRRREGPD